MEKSVDKRAQRLTSRPQFLHVAKGTKAAMPGFILQARRRPEEGGSPSSPGTAPCRIGFTVTKKVGNAVVRNRAKRRLRAVADAVLPAHGHAGYDYVLVGRTTTRDRVFAALCDDLQKALKNIHQQRKTVITHS